MKKTYISGLVIALTILIPGKVSAHCPLCTGGAGAAAVVAAYFGVKYGALGVLLGGFSVALGLWIAHKPKQRFKYQSLILFWAIYLSTIIPFYYMFRGDYVSKYISMNDDYGSLLNRTYLIDLFIIGAVLGSIALFVAPKLSLVLSEKRGGKSIRFQGILISFALLILSSVILQFWPR